jgi:hypothetical protein
MSSYKSIGAIEIGEKHKRIVEPSVIDVPTLRSSGIAFES